MCRLHASKHRNAAMLRYILRQHPIYSLTAVYRNPFRPRWASLEIHAQADPLAHKRFFITSQTTQQSFCHLFPTPLSSRIFFRTPPPFGYAQVSVMLAFLIVSGKRRLFNHALGGLCGLCVALFVVGFRCGAHFPSWCSPDEAYASVLRECSTHKMSTPELEPATL